ncbi:unnamed protein product [Blumeria hordei]|uniref:nicotinamidase n=2 Tax=Blumeria hordei TaxID=2867405 RepID=A0A383UNG0_BLUHO|nr:hypothetical protein BGHDH14_bgh00254 [Blumeria hordei DH14]SZF01105.1 unnamed protein product [Blumeria hordei]
MTSPHSSPSTPEIERPKSSPPFVPALIIVDLQEDFCPPNGSLIVPNARDIIPTINQLLDYPFILKVATKDSHPKTHISFASNHIGKSAFSGSFTQSNPINPNEKYSIRLWPDHCVKGTPGADLVHELATTKIDMLIEKGTDEASEMYSGFYDMWGRGSDLLGVLKAKNVTHVWITGLALEYCVKETAIHAAREGFETVVVREGTKAIDDTLWAKITDELAQSGVRVVSDADEKSLTFDMSWGTPKSFS